MHEPDGYYSWLVALVGAIALVFTLGTPFSYGIFLKPFRELYALSSLSVSVLFSLQLFASYSIAGVISVLATRYQPRHVLLGIAGVTGLLAPSLYIIDFYFGLVLIFTVLGAAVGSVVIMIVSIVPQWFDNRRGVATGALFVGVGLSLFVMPPAWDLAFSQVGVRTGFFLLVGLSACSFIGAGIVCQPPPWTSQTPVPLTVLRKWIRRLVRTKQFQLLILGFGFAFTWFYLLAGFSVDYFTNRGISSGAASFAFGLIGGISIFSRLGSGAVADRFGFSRTMVLFLSCAGVGCLLLLLPGVVAIYSAILFFGIGLGGVTTLYVPILLEIYNPDKSTAIVGIFSIGLGVTALFAPPVATMLVSASGSFIPVIVLTLGTVLVAIVLIWVGTNASRGPVASDTVESRSG